MLVSHQPVHHHWKQELDISLGVIPPSLWTICYAYRSPHTCPAPLGHLQLPHLCVQPLTSLLSTVLPDSSHFSHHASCPDAWWVERERMPNEIIYLETQLSSQYLHGFVHQVTRSSSPSLCTLYPTNRLHFLNLYVHRNHGFRVLFILNIILYLWIYIFFMAIRAEYVLDIPKSKWVNGWWTSKGRRP